MVCSVRRFLDQARTGNAIAVSIRRFVTRASFATVVALRLQKQAFVENVWDISNWQLRFLISGISMGFLPVWD